MQLLIRILAKRFFSNPFIGHLVVFPSSLHLDYRTQIEKGIIGFCLHDLGICPSFLIVHQSL